MTKFLINFLSIAAVTAVCKADRISPSTDLLDVLKRQVQNTGGSFQAGGSPSSANNQQPSLFVQPGTFTDPSFSSSSNGAQSSGSSSNGTSSSNPSSGSGSPFVPSFLDPIKFLSTGQFSPAFPGTGGSTSGSAGSPPGTSGSGSLFPLTSGPGLFPPGTSGSGGLFPLTVNGVQGNSTGSALSGVTSTGTNSTAGSMQSMYPNMFMNPNQFVG